MVGMSVMKRGFSTSTAKMMTTRHPFYKEHKGGMDLWRRMSYFVALPACIIIGVNVGLHMKKEMDCPPPRMEFVPYEHLRIRTKRFPWGDGNKSFFHNPHVNALPNGYEEDEHH